jgi:tetratricopeptide (TPR) repeat protein
MVRFKIFISIILFVFLVIPQWVSGQDEAGGLFVSGRITTEQGNVGGSVIKLFRNGQPMVDYQVDNTGRFNLRFEFNNEYVLVFMRPDNFPQKYTVSTVVPTEVLRRDRKFPPYPLDVNLFTEIKGINTSFAEHTVLRIFFSQQVDNFIHEVYYNNPQIKKLIEQAILQSQSVRREDELLKRLTAAELAALKREYDEILKKAGGEFDRGEYILALDDYKMASRIFPAEQFPKDRIAEINDLIAVLGLQAELERQQTEKYNQFIRQADMQFKAKEYPVSKENYNNAIFVRPGDTYASSQIAEIDRLVAEMQTQQRYGDLIAVADNAFKEKLWDESKRRYQEAQQIRPSETYPRNQISRIDEELLKLSQMAEKQSTFEAAVLNGDASYAKQFYPKALEFYRTALSIKPDDPGVIAKIARVEKEQKEINDKLFYDETIANADRAFKRLEYAQARELYSTALTIRPDQLHPQRQIEAIDKIADKNKEYDNLISRADASLAAENYNSARDDFRSALDIKPGEKYPAQKIKDIDAVLATLAKEDQQYRQLIAGADKFFNAGQFLQAKTEYQKAASQRPSDSYPPEMLNKIADREADMQRLADEQKLAEQNRLLAEQQERDQRYQSLITEADNLAAKEEMVSAVSKFRDAMEVKPQEAYPLQRIEEIRGIIARQTETQKTYDTAIAAADRAFQQQQYPAARTGYQQAQQAKASEAYPAEQLAKIDAIEAEQARQLAEKQAADEVARLAAMEAKDREYAEAIANADGLFNQQQYIQAIAEYRKASQVKPDENYPKERITESDRLNTVMAAAQKAYDTAIAAADRAFQQQQYAAARTGYQQAQQAKASEAYPAEQLAKIDAIEAEQARQLAEKQAADEAARLAAMEAKDREYAEAIANADGLFNQQQYIQAIAEYRKASQVKPDENYPKERITESDRLNTAMAAAQKAYDTAIAAADRAFQQQQYAAARTGYQQAQQAKASEAYPAEQLAKIDAIEAEQARQLAEKQAADEAARLAAMEAKDREYAEAIANADGLFNQQQYIQAIAEYRKASQVKPDENYPKERITESDRLNTAMAAAQKAYDTAIAAADRAFRQQQYPAARTGYQQAQQAKASEAYPAEQLAKIDAIEAEQARQLAEKQAADDAARLAAMEAKDREYAEAISRADGLFDQQQYLNAIAEYRKASQVKPDENYPKERITESDRLNTALAASQKAYDTAIAAADRAFQQQQYPAARTGYQQAQQAKANENYPAEQLAKIDAIEAEQARQLAEKQATEEAARLAAMEAKDREYAETISRADGFFNQQRFVQAIAEYRKASQVKPDENYPKERIIESDRMNIEIAVAQKAYDTAIAAADRAFQRQEYDEARKGYQQAQKAKSGETYPLEQMAKIDAIEVQLARELAQKQAAEEAARLATMEAKDREYSEAISRADGLFNQQQYIPAIAEYRIASQVKPEENYPKEKISESERLNTELLALENQNREYARLIGIADRAFNNQEYSPASVNYKAAILIRPDEIHPKERIEQIENILRQREADERYRQALLAGDGFFRGNNWEQARGEYQKALDLKPSEEYPKRQIERIDETLQKLAQRNVPATTIQSQAQQSASSQVPVTSQPVSSERVITDPNEAYYHSLIALADETFTASQYNVSRAWYYKALDIKPAEVYPSERIAEINRILGSLQLSQREREFQQFINQGDEAFRKDELAVARGWYNRALTINSGDEYARLQITEIQQTINSRLQGGADQVYGDYIKEGDKALALKNYSVARVWFQRASQLKPNESVPREKLEEVRKALAGE